jgi:hypothetical protein
MDCHGLPHEQPCRTRRYSPYFLLFGRHRIVGSRVRDIVAEPIDLDDALKCAAIMRERALLFRKIMPMAFDNLAIAQHRDTLRQPADSMDPKSGRIILRVKKVLGTGRLLLEGRDTKTIKEHVENCAPCHNPNIDLFQNPALADQDIDQACGVCQNTAVNRRTGTMLLCDNCNTGWHMKCLTPPVRKLPARDWFCFRCPVADQDVP